MKLLSNIFTEFKNKDYLIKTHIAFYLRRGWKLTANYFGTQSSVQTFQPTILIKRMRNFVLIYWEMGMYINFSSIVFSLMIPKFFLVIG